jgi:hypothetical protein
MSASSIAGGSTAFFLIPSPIAMTMEERGAGSGMASSWAPWRECGRRREGEM